MPMWQRTLMALAVFLLLRNSAQAAVGDITYGPWSGWTYEPIENATNLFVETRETLVPVTRRAWRYTRFRVEREDGVFYMPTAEKASGAQAEICLTDQALPQTGVVFGHPVYEGDWYNQESLTLSDHFTTATQYRWREIFAEICSLEPASLILEVGEHKALGIQTLTSDEAYSLSSGDSSIISVTPDGLVSAISPGRTQIILYYQQTQIAAEVLVVGEKAEFSEGAIALRLSGSNLTAGYKAGRKSVTEFMLYDDGGKTVNASKRLYLDGVEGDCFSMRALCPRIAYLSAPLSDEGAVSAGEAGIFMRKDILDRWKEISKLQKLRREATASDDADEAPDDEYATFFSEGSAAHRLRAYPTPQGDYVLCMQADNGYALTARSAEQGAGLSIEKLDLNNPLQRWTLTPEKEDVTKDTLWRLPVADNSFCEITDDFKTMQRDHDKHDGVDFSPTTDKRVVAVQSGRVIRADNKCTHDYAKKTKNKYGRYIDPCMKDDDGEISKYGSYGKYVMIEHDDGTVSMYAHLSEIKVKSGQRVKKGQVIGKMGSTGSSNGAHLHFEVRVSGRAVDPRYFLNLPEIGQYVP